MKKTSMMLAVCILVPACGGKLEDRAPAPEAAPAPEETRPQSGCAIPTGDMVVSEHAVGVRTSKSGCRIAVHEQPEQDANVLTLVESDGSDRRRLTDRLTVSALAKWRGIFAWAGEVLVDVEDGKLVARDDEGRGSARELAHDVVDFVVSHDERFVLYEDVGGASHAVSIDGRRRVDLPRRLGQNPVGLSDFVTAGPPGAMVAVVRKHGICDGCLDFERTSCEGVGVFRIEGAASYASIGPALLLDVHRPSARMLVDVRRPDGTHGVELVDLRALDRREPVLDFPAAVKTHDGSSEEVQCVGASGGFSPSGSKLAITLYAQKSRGEHGRGTELREDRLFDAAAAPRELRATSAGVDIVEAADDGLLVRRFVQDGMQLAAEGWGDAISRVVADLAGEWKTELEPLGGGAWLAQPKDPWRAPVVVTRAGATTLEAPSELVQVFERRFAMTLRGEGDAGPTHLYETSTLRRTAVVPAGLRLEALAGNDEVLVVAGQRTQRGTWRLTLRPN